MNKYALAFISGFLIMNCSSNQLEPLIQEYIQVYQERSDFDAFLSYYAEDMIIEDMITGYRVEGKKGFAEFFNWPDPRFESRHPNTYEVETLIIDGQKVTIQGYFTPFSWDGQEVEAMQFVTILFFNDKNKIIKHVDWINYPNSLIDYQTRGNSNEWIK